MTGRVTRIHAEDPPAEPPAAGAFGLRWTAERMPATNRWAVVGRAGTAHSLSAVLEVRFHPRGVPPEDIARVLAQLANDYDEGAAALMAAALEAETPDPTN